MGSERSIDEKGLLFVVHYLQLQCREFERLGGPVYLFRLPQPLILLAYTPSIMFISNIIRHFCISSVSFPYF